MRMLISKGRRRAYVATVHSEGIFSAGDHLNSDAEARLIEQQSRLQGCPATLDLGSVQDFSHIPQATAPLVEDCSA